GDEQQDQREGRDRVQDARDPGDRRLETRMTMRENGEREGDQETDDDRGEGQPRVLEPSAPDLVQMVADPAPQDERLTGLCEHRDHVTISLEMRSSVRMPA